MEMASRILELLKEVENCAEGGQRACKSQDRKFRSLALPSLALLGS